MSPGPPLDLGKRGWLARLLEVYLQVRDPSAAAAAVACVREARPEASLDELAAELARARLRGVGLRPGRSLLPAALAEHPACEGLASDDVQAVGLLVTQWDILGDIACLHEDASEPREFVLELLTVMALGLGDYPLARKTHQAHFDPDEQSAERVRACARRVEAKLAPRGRGGSQAALSIGIGLAYLEARSLARIASLYFQRAAIEEEGIARLHELSRVQRERLIEILANVAWADGEVSAEERRLIEHQVERARLGRKTSKRLLGLLDQSPEPGGPALEALDPGVRRFVLEQAILLSLVDDELDATERDLLRSIAVRLGGSQEELERIAIEVAAYYETHRESIRDFGPVSGSLGRLRALVLDRTQAAIRSNMRKIVQEVKETGELAVLLGAASTRKLSPQESEKVKAQLLDICKTIPALAIFALPGGGLLLPVLIRLLPFNILPTAFQDAPG